jgi:hypothetical protein
MSAVWGNVFRYEGRRPPVVALGAFRERAYLNAS